jgi:hypothetical protein
VGRCFGLPPHAGLPPNGAAAATTTRARPRHEGRPASWTPACGQPPAAWFARELGGGAARLADSLRADARRQHKLAAAALDRAHARFLAVREEGDPTGQQPGTRRMRRRSIGARDDAAPMAPGRFRARDGPHCSGRMTSTASAPRRRRAWAPRGKWTSPAWRRWRGLAQTRCGPLRRPTLRLSWPAAVSSGRALGVGLRVLRRRQRGHQCGSACTVATSRFCMHAVALERAARAGRTPRTPPADAFADGVVAAAAAEFGSAVQAAIDERDSASRLQVRQRWVCCSWHACAATLQGVCRCPAVHDETRA